MSIASPELRHKSNATKAGHPRLAGTLLMTRIAVDQSTLCKAWRLNGYVAKKSSGDNIVAMQAKRKSVGVNPAKERRGCESLD